ncbi:hypothetical protein ACQ4M3_06055 [Leptolyngbya sp. AN03gr2]|uniref:hypothetical protein n=1 Tax=unclassified Leptolyngbya TaxID=2650499 RepID=UPI003D317223
MLDLKNSSLLGGVFSGLILGVPLISTAALATPNPRVNPCPSVYYEEPYNSRLIVPQTCPPNAITQFIRQNPSALNRATGGVGSDLPGRNLTPNRIVPSDAPTTPGTVGQRPSVFSEAPYNRNPPGTPMTLPVQPPLPEQRSQPVASVVPSNGTINVRVKNETNAIVTYEAVQYTQRRVLRPGEEAVLQNLPVPVTVTFVRQDNGFVEVIPVTTPEQGILSLQLDEDRNPLDSNQGVIRVQRNGQVFLN